MYWQIFVFYYTQGTHFYTLLFTIDEHVDEYICAYLGDVEGIADSVYMGIDSRAGPDI